MFISNNFMKELEEIVFDITWKGTCSKCKQI